MPTCNRRHYVAQALHYFLRQNYTNRELVIIDDGSDPIEDLIPVDKRINYYRFHRHYVIGVKRNLACERAKGTLIVHWDDDDWSAEWRISYQVAGLLNMQADICGLDQIQFFDPAMDKAWLYSYKGKAPWVYGATFCYRKTFWEQHPFPEVASGEDTRLLQNIPSAQVAVLDDNNFFIGIIHESNTSPKQIGTPNWLQLNVEPLKAILGGDLSFYSK